MGKKTIAKSEVKKKSEPGYRISTFTERIWLGVIVLLTFFVYSNSLKNGFCWDDSLNVVNNEDLKGLTWQSFFKLITTPYVGMYTPVTGISYFLNYILAKTNPTFYHFTNLLLHLVVVILLFRFIKLLSSRQDAALIGCVLFAIHPMNTEVVAWISSRSTSVFCIFLLISLMQYIKYVRTGRKKKLIYSLLFFVLACLGKPSAMVLPILLFVIDHFEKRELNIKLLYDKIVFFVISILSGLLTIYLRIHEDAVNDLHSKYNLFDKLLLSTYGLSYYLIKFLVPSNLTCSYGLPLKTGGYLSIEYYFSALVLVVFAVLFFRKNSYQRFFQFGLLFYMISLSIVLPVLPFGRDIVAARYSYLPYMGICFITGTLLADVFKYKINSVLMILGITIVIFSFVTYDRNKVWKDDGTLFTDASEKNTSNYFPYFCLGVKYVNDGNFEEALKNFNISYGLNNQQPDLLYARSGVIGRLGNFKAAIDDQTQAMKFSSPNAHAYYNRGTLWGSLNEFAKAKQDLDSSIKMKPDFGDAYFNRGMANISLNDTAAACADWRKALSLGNMYAQQKIVENCK